ncbi:transcriptional activator Mut3p [Paramyrothecium foliicola]|nr:transcriptional activator Mut3p [Paramyrothecium foliicola]
MAGDKAEDGAGPSDWHGADPPSPTSSTKSDQDLDDGNPDAPSQPIQKRRRVTRACDECRRKKIKCDGKQPCTHCSVYSYECTYDKPSNRRRNPAPQYIEALEGRLQRAESLLRKFMPDVDLADPNLDPAVQQEFQNREKQRAGQNGKQRSSVPSSNAGSDPNQNEAQLTSMINSIGQLDMDDKGGWDFHGVSSGAVFLRRMKEHFRGMLGPVSKVPFLPRSERPAGLTNLDSPSPAPNSPFSVAPSPLELPPKEVTRNLCYYSLSCATCLVRIVHAPSFYDRLDKLYDKPLDNLSSEDNHFLGLVFSILALGCMYNRLDDNSTESPTYKTALDEGLKYYTTARNLIQDITECRDLTSVQALLFQILFLQATSNLSGCYAFVGIALRSALRIGLHRHLEHDQIGIVEHEVRRRVFWVIRQMDIYTSTLLGFPLMLSSDDIDQMYPTEVDDEYITPNGILQPPPGTPSFFEAFNAHTRLMEILSKITKHVYPMKGLGQSVGKGEKATSTYRISYARIKEIEADLQDWYERLPETWRPSAEGPIEVIRVRHLLRFAYAHVQLVLYRPFLHYVSPRLSQGNQLDELSYACAAAAISVSRNIVHIGLEIRKQRVLSGPYWFMLYTEFFAVLSLVFYAIENPEKPGSSEVLADARAGRKMIADLADKTQSAERVTSALKVLFDQLPENLESGQLRAAPSKKRSATTAKHSAVPPHHSPMTANRSSSQLSEDLMRSRSGAGPSTMFSKSGSRSSADNMHSTSDAMFQDAGFATNFDFGAMDMSSRATPDSTSTGTSSHATIYPGQALNSRNPVHKLDSLMFPSEDPFAYPNQPMMELGFQPKPDGTPITMTDQGPDSQFLFTGQLDEIESQFFGQPPPYMMGQPQPPMQQFMNFSDNMFDPNSLLGFQAQAPMAAQQQQQPQGGPMMPQQRRHQNRHQQRRIEQIFTEHGMQPDWGGFFGSGRRESTFWGSGYHGRREDWTGSGALGLTCHDTDDFGEISDALGVAFIRAFQAFTGPPNSPSASADMEPTFHLVHEDEFDAILVETTTGVEKDYESLKGKKYPAREHVRKVIAELDVEDGLIFLPGEPTRLYEDSDMGPRFRQRRYFYYITGANFADCAVTYEIAAGKLTLWIPYVEPRQVLWFGSTPDAARALQLYDVDEVRYTTQLPKFLHSHLTKPSSPTLYILHPEQGPAVGNGLFGQGLAASSTRVDFTSLQPAMDRARVVKTDHEVALIRRANAVSSAAHRRVAENLLALNNEQEIEALFRAGCTVRGAHSQAYAIIAGAGVNASTLHYDANDQPLKGKQLVVIDAGCEWDCYASDITRTLPISGSFTPEAAAIHDLVQRMQDQCIAAVRPGALYYKLHLLAHAVALAGLRELGILRGDPGEIARVGTTAAFFPHGLGHHVGLECHDVTGSERLLLMTDSLRVEGGKRETVPPTALLALGREAADEEASGRPYKGRQHLKPNMIVTVEPGIYFCREYIEGYFLRNPTHAKYIDKDVLEKYYDVGGVRIEDDILVTEDGYENLTTAPKGKELLDAINGGFEHL